MGNVQNSSNRLIVFFLTKSRIFPQLIQWCERNTDVDILQNIDIEPHLTIYSGNLSNKRDFNALIYYLKYSRSFTLQFSKFGCFHEKTKDVIVCELIFATVQDKKRFIHLFKICRHFLGGQEKTKNAPTLHVTLVTVNPGHGNSIVHELNTLFPLKFTETFSKLVVKPYGIENSGGLELALN
jgi:hypothetical protein